MIEEQSHAYPIRELCAALKVSRSGYYGWRAGQESARELANRVVGRMGGILDLGISDPGRSAVW